MDSTDVIRLLIVANATNQALEGAHYLNGSDGGHPGKKDGNKGRDIKLVERGEFDEVAIHTATRSDKSCTGRCSTVGGSTVKSKAKLNEIKEYCKENLDKGLDPAYWEPFENQLYPRRYRAAKDSSLYLGEDCRDKRHFDCISFVNWVLATTLRRPFDYSIKQFEGNKEGKGRIAPVKTYTGKFPELQNADILTRITWEEEKGDNNKWDIESKHIGFYIHGGKVVHASGAKKGVIISSYKRDNWTAVCRLKKHYLKFGA